MSANHLQKISPKVLAKVLALVGLLFLIVGNARIILENILKSKDIDERIVSEANPRLNREKVKEAERTLQSVQKNADLTAIFPSVTVEGESPNTTETGKRSVEIQNASGIIGAAAILAEVLGTEGYQVSAISTAPSIQEKTTVFYRVGLEREAQSVKEILEQSEWSVGLVQQTEELEFDIHIVLGKK